MGTFDLSGEKPPLKNENLCSTINVLITDGTVIPSSRHFLLSFDFRTVQI